MKKLKFLTILSTLLILLTAQAGAALAAPSMQEPAVNTVTALECGVDGTTVLVTYDDGDLNTPEVVVEISNPFSATVIKKEFKLKEMQYKGKLEI